MAFTSMVKDLNARQVIECMRDGHVYTKQELAYKTRLSFPTVGKLIDRLAEDEKIVSLGTDENSQGGRKAELYRVNEDFAHILLLFVQEQKVFYRVSDALEKQISRGERMRREGQSIVEQMKDIATQCLEQDKKIQSMVVGIPGAVYQGQIKLIDGYEELKGRYLEKELADCTGLSVRISNNMSALACGAAKRMCRQKENLVCIHLASTGPGCGAVVNGKPVTGYKGFSGEVGFMPLFGEETLQDVALNHFDKVEPGEYLGKLISCICALINPESVTLYLEHDWENIERKTYHWCRKFLPEEMIPRLIFSDSYQEDYFYGLTVLGTDLLFTDLI